jgi:CDGSH-type Zn-finger protein
MVALLFCDGSIEKTGFKTDRDGKGALFPPEIRRPEMHRVPEAREERI